MRLFVNQIMFKVTAFGNTFAIIDIILHPFFHLWVAISPRSYEWLMHFFVAGLHVQVTEFDISFSHIFFSTIIEASIFWILGVSVAFLYNKLAKE